MAAICGRSASENTDPEIVSTYGFFFAAVFLAIFTRPNILFALNSPRILWTGFLYGLIPTSFTYTAYYAGIKKIHDTSRVPVIASVEPVAAVMLGLLLYHEPMNTANFIGVAVVLSSIIIMARAK